MEHIYPAGGACHAKEMSVIYKNHGTLDFYGGILPHAESFLRTGVQLKLYLVLERLPCEISLPATPSLESLERLLETC